MRVKVIGGGVVEVSKYCRAGKHEVTIHVPVDEFMAWDSGGMIQTAMPSVTADDRELLISGTCGPCFDKMFKEEES